MTEMISVTVDGEQIDLPRRHIDTIAEHSDNELHTAISDAREDARYERLLERVKEALGICGMYRYHRCQRQSRPDMVRLRSHNGRVSMDIDEPLQIDKAEGIAIKMIRDEHNRAPAGIYVGWSDDE